MSTQDEREWAIVGMCAGFVLYSIVFGKMIWDSWWSPEFDFMTKMLHTLIFGAPIYGSILLYPPILLIQGGVRSITDCLGKFINR